MRKKIVRNIEANLPRLYDADGVMLSRRDIANRIVDSIPHPERLDLQPFERFIPFVCSTCKYNDGHRLGCTYEMYNEQHHEDFPTPKDCPLGHV